jgi:hypothetical protein
MCQDQRGGESDAEGVALCKYAWHNNSGAMQTRYENKLLFGTYQMGLEISGKECLSESVPIVGWRPGYPDGGVGLSQVGVPS